MSFHLVIFLLLATVSLLNPAGSALQTTQYCITPSTDTPCPAEPCLTLNQFAQDVQQSLTPITTLVLLPGDHNLTSVIRASNVSHLSMLGKSPPGVVSSRIVCTSPATFTFENISEFEISTIAIVSCGASGTSSVVHVRSVQHFELSNITLQDSADVSLKVTESNGILQGVQFIGSFGVGMVVTNSTVTIKGGNTFLDNFGGGVASRDSVECSLINNSAQQIGGGISGWNGTVVNISGKSSFVNNSAQYNGGGISVRGSLVHISVECSFINNSAQIGGGIVGSNNNTLCISGKSSFIQNSANVGGGIFVSYNSTMKISGESRFINNIAWHGGGINAQIGSVANISGKCNLINNKAQNRGGGIAALDGCTLYISGESSFINNSAHSGGGIVAMNLSAVTLSGESWFTENWSHFGGGALIYQSDITLSGTTNFVNNSAFYGGAIYAFIGILTFSRDGNLVQNSASFCGGALSLAGGSRVYFAINSSLYIGQNDATLYGGAIYVDDTLLTHSYCTSEELYVSDTCRLHGT